MPLIRLWLIVGAIWLFLPVAVVSPWPALLWWMALLLSRSARPWTATILAVFFGMQIGVLTQRLLGLDVLLFGASVALLELWSDSVTGWRRRAGDLFLGGVFCAVFLFVGGSFRLDEWLSQLSLLLVASGVEVSLGVWWNRK